MIFRHLLVYPDALKQTCYDSFPKLDILKASRLIYKEASDVFYKENSFHTSLWDPSYKIRRAPRVADTIQSIETYICLSGYLRHHWELDSDLPEFINVMHHLGNSSITRRSLVVDLDIGAPRLLKGFVSAFGRFTNFRVVELHIREPPYSESNNRRECCDRLQTALEPMFGYAEECESNRNRWLPGAKGLRFHPVDHQNHSRTLDDGDCEYLDGIRLSWNETLTDDSRGLTQE